MKLKRLLSIVLLVFAGGSLVFALVSDRSVAGKSNSAPTEPVNSDSDVVVYYMDMGKDCSTCLNLESYTLEALNTFFPEELASGRLQWRTVDLDDSANAHFIDEFKLYTKSVVLVRYDQGEQKRYESLSRIWELVYDRDDYLAYIQKEVQAFLDNAEALE